MEKDNEILIDEYYVSNWNDKILIDNGEIYKIILNQTNLKNNNNKFYKMEIIYKENFNKYDVFKRYGRVGDKGQKITKSFKQKEKAIQEYNKTLREKLKKNYIKVQVKISNEVKEKKNDWNDEKDDGINDFNKKFNDKNLTNLISLIFSKTVLKKDLENIGFDSNKMPLGQLTDEAFNKAFKILKKLNFELDSKIPNQKNIERLNSKFFSNIPHIMERRNIVKNFIDTKIKVQEKNLNLVSLKNLRFTQKILNQNTNLLKLYNSLNIQIETINKGSQLYKDLENGLYNTHSGTHYFKMKVLNIFELNKDEDYDNKFENKILLWHGSRISNFVGILSNSLKIAPPEAPVSGYMFGKGVYFADLSSKSAQYTRYGLFNQIGFLLLCEVGVGKPNIKYQADYNADKLPKGYHCTLGNGKNIPSDYININSAKFYNGNIIKNPDSNGSLYYNEYIVYNTSQIKMKYLFEIKFS